MATGWKNGLRKGPDGLQYFRFAWRGRNYEGCTGHTNPRKAKDWVDQYRSRLSNAEVGLRDAPLVKDAFQAWKESRKGKVGQAHLDRADRAWSLHVLPHIGDYPADQVNSEAVELLISRYLDGRTPAGANTLLLYIKTVFGHLVRMGYLRALPFQVKAIRCQQPVRSFVPGSSLIQFLAAVDRTENLHQTVAVRAMLFLGLREAEALGMRWEWFSNGIETYTVGKAKGKEAWPLPVHPDLQAWLRNCAKLSPWVIPAEDGEPHRAQFTVKAIMRAGKAIGIANLTPHSMRRSCATLLARANVDPYTIQRILRHKDQKTTQGYVQVDQEALSHAVATLGSSAHR